MPRLRHLNCGTMHAPLAGRLVCHVLLVEAADGLVLVDTGFGLQDIAEPGPRLGPTRHLIRPVLDPDETAARQVRALGHRPQDVRHIVVTHFDLDHIGGLADFPDAQVHVSADEATGAVHHPSRRERLRFRARQWAHGPHLVEHAVQGDAWRGFDAAEQLSEVDDGIVLIALPGHTRGHAAVAVRDGERWVLHAGDAFYHRSAIGGDGRQPAVITAMERGVAWDNRLAVANRARLAELNARHEPDLDIVSAHDPELLARLQA